MIIHIFNSSVVSGPETLAIPALKKLGEPVTLIFLTETRLGDRNEAPVAYGREQGYEVHTVPVRGRWDRRAFMELRQVLDRLQARIVHAHDVKASLYLLQASKAKPGFKAAMVSTHHGAAARKGKIRLYEEFYVRWVLPRFHAVLCVCDGDRLSLLRRGIPSRILHVHHNGVDRPFIAPEERPSMQRQIRQRWRSVAPGLPDSDKALYLGAVARLSDEKRHDRMLRALKAAQSSLSHRSVVLLCFGVGAEESRLKEMAVSLGLDDSVFWMGYSKTVSQEMAGFDLLLCLSDGEGIPINLLEAGWSGTPVLSTRVGGIPDIIDENVGCLVNKLDTDLQIGSTLAALLKDDRRRESLGLEYQRRITNRFSEKAWLHKLTEVYQSISS